MRILVAALLMMGLSSLAATSIGEVPRQNCSAVTPQTCDIAHALGRGINLGSMFELASVGAKNPLSPDLLRLVVDNFKTVRIPVRWTNNAAPTADAKLDERFAERIDAVVDELLASGRYVILDLHHYNQIFGDRLDKSEFPVSDDVLETRLLKVWEQLAGRYAGRSQRLIFELLNEPHGRMSASRWNTLASRALSIVRRTNPTRVVIVGPVFWNNVRELPSLTVPGDRNLIVTFHNYEPFEFTHQGAPFVSRPLPTGITCCSLDQTAQIINVFNQAAIWNVQTGYPLYLGEFGSFDTGDMTSRATFTRTVRTAAEQLGIGWAFWDLSTSFGVYSPAKQAWHEPLRRALFD